MSGVANEYMLLVKHDGKVHHTERIFGAQKTDRRKEELRKQHQDSIVECIPIGKA